MSGDHWSGSDKIVTAEDVALATGMHPLVEIEKVRASKNKPFVPVSQDAETGEIIISLKGLEEEEEEEEKEEDDPMIEEPVTTKKSVRLAEKRKKREDETVAGDHSNPEEDRCDSKSKISVKSKPIKKKKRDAKVKEKLNDSKGMTLRVAPARKKLGDDMVLI